MTTTRNHCQGVLGVSTTELMASVIDVYDDWPGPSSEGRRRVRSAFDLGHLSRSRGWGFRTRAR